MSINTIIKNDQTKAIVTVFASAARTATTTNSSDQDNDPQQKGVRLFLDITAVSGTSPTLDVKLQVKDPVSAKYEDMAGAAFAQKTGTGQDIITIYPGIAETADESVSDILGSTWRIVATIGGTATPTFTYSLSGDYL